MFAAAVGLVAQGATAPVDAWAPAGVTDSADLETPADVTSPEAAEMADLMSIIDEETAIATETRMNSDYVPGIVAVLQGAELRAMGAATVWEALSFVPGVEPILDPRGRPSAIVRGMYFPFNMGNVKVLVNGVPLSREASGINSFVLYLPIEQLERIEVIRGPGSIQYGDMAFMGLVNIVTRAAGTGLFARGSTSRAGVGGAYASVERDGVRASVNVAGARSFSSEVLAGRRADAEQGSGMFGLEWGGLSLSAMLLDTTVLETMQTTVTGASLNNAETDWALDGGYKHQFGGTFDAGAHVSYLRNSVTEDSTRFEGDQMRSALEFEWRGLRRQVWSAALEFTQSRIDLAERYVARPPAPPGLPQPEPLHMAVTGERRDVYSALLQDNLTLGDDFSLIPGARFDAFSDIGRRITPRFAAVWRAAEHHIVKAQYSEGFRAPTFFELHEGDGTPRDLTFEINRTAELNYILRVPNMVGRLTLFGMRIEQMMYIVGADDFANTAAGRAFGVEAEWSREVTKLIKLSANAAWVDNRDSRQTGALRRGAAVAGVLGDMGVLLMPLEATSLGLHLVHLAERPAAGGYDMLDVTLSRERLFGAGLGVRAGVKNTLDSAVDYIMVRPEQTATYRATGRTFWAGLAYQR